MTTKRNPAAANCGARLTDLAAFGIGNRDSKGLQGDQPFRTHARSSSREFNAANLRRVEKNTLKAFFDLELPPGLILRDCTLHFREHWWVGFPARPYQDQNGKGSWARIVDFSSKVARDQFQEMVLEAALSAYEACQC
jgi:hypothetical protein